MAELVDLEEVLKILDRRLNLDDRTRYVFEKILELPIVKVAAADHGARILSGDKVICNRCKTILFGLSKEELNVAQRILPYLGNVEKFCFNCGADMRCQRGNHNGQ